MRRLLLLVEMHAVFALDCRSVALVPGRALERMYMGLRCGYDRGS